MGHSLRDKNWSLHAKRADFDALSARFGIDKVTARILVNRDVAEGDMEAFISPGKGDLNDPHLMAGLDEAADIVTAAIRDKKKIRIIGDYDIDGICSTYVLYECIGRLKGDVDYYLPKRIEDGYGINESMVDDALEEGVDLILTCDNGISAGDAIKKAEDAGITVIVTDHHEVPKDETGADILPPARVVVNPKRADCLYPFKDICGCTVAWKLTSLLFEQGGLGAKTAWDYVEFPAFATVGDIMPLKNENRTIVSFGLKIMGHTKNLGLSTLIECCNLAGRQINTFHLGFVMGPCLNAGGRLADASLGVELFTTKDRERATEISEHLKELNEERKDMTADGTKAAIEHIESSGMDKDRVIICYLPDIHESLCGIIAGRIKERFYRPSFMVTDGDGFIKGSGRSVPAYSMCDKMSECKDLYIKYGGHPMAAGFSFENKNLEAIRAYLNEHCDLSEEDLTEKVMIDVAMPFSYISMGLIRELELLEPYGNGNPKPIFARKSILVMKIFRMGKNNEFAKLRLCENDVTMDAVYFGDADALEEEVSVGSRIDILYFPQINSYRGVDSLQIELIDYKLSKEES